MPTTHCKIYILIIVENCEKPCKLIIILVIMFSKYANELYLRSYMIIIFNYQHQNMQILITFLQFSCHIVKVFIWNFDSWFTEKRVWWCQCKKSYIVIISEGEPLKYHKNDKKSFLLKNQNYILWKFTSIYSTCC